MVRKILQHVHSWISDTDMEPVLAEGQYQQRWAPGRAKYSICDSRGCSSVLFSSGWFHRVGLIIVPQSRDPTCSLTLQHFCELSSFLHWTPFLPNELSQLSLPRKSHDTSSIDYHFNFSIISTSVYGDPLSNNSNARLKSSELNRRMHIQVLQVSLRESS